MTVAAFAPIALGCIFAARLLAIAVALASRHRPALRQLAWTCGAIADLAALLTGLLAVLGGTQPILGIFGGDMFGSAGLTVDSLSGFFLFITGMVSLPLTFFSAAGPWEGKQREWLSSALASYHLLLFATTLVLCAANAFVFLFAWELTSLAMYLAIVSRYDQPRAASEAYFTLSLAKVPAAALVAAFLLLVAGTGGFAFSTFTQMGPALSAPLRSAVLVLALIGFGAKVGLLPMQVWLPRGYPAAPSNAAAVMAGIVLNLGIYGLIRVGFDFLGPAQAWWGLIVMLGGAFTAFIGILYGVVQNDLKRFISYSSVEHAGIILIGVGVALIGKADHLPLLAGAGLVAACLHLLQHAVAKSLLFAGSGGIERVAGTTDMAELGGLAHRAPWLGGVMLVGVLSLAAMPPLGGFTGEWLTFEALMQGFRLGGEAEQLGTAIAGALLALTAGLALIAFVKVYGIVFLGVPRSESAAKAGDVDGSAARALAILAFLTVAIGVGAPWAAQFAAASVAVAAGANVATVIAVWPHLAIQPAFANFSSTSPTELIIALPLFLLIPLALRALLHRHGQSLQRAKVWTSASGWPEPDVEYTPLAFSNMARVIFQMLYRLRRSLRVTAPELFPPELRYQSTINYAFESLFYRPLVAAALAITAAVRRTQSGVLSLYLLYMLLVLLAILAVTRVVVGG
ncbi:MAG: hypothetical protein M1118_12935 [Chloroflexi bacterium]|nr:hypothetical protein [Chloroflexota bacterium]